MTTTSIRWRSAAAAAAITLAASTPATAMVLVSPLITASTATLRVGDALTLHVAGTSLNTGYSDTVKYYGPSPEPEFLALQNRFHYEKRTSIWFWFAELDFYSSDKQRQILSTRSPYIGGDVLFQFLAPGTYHLDALWTMETKETQTTITERQQRWCAFWICDPWQVAGVSARQDTIWGPSMHYQNIWSMDVTVLPALQEQPLPEPATLPLAGAACMALALARPRRQPR